MPVPAYPEPGFGGNVLDTVIWKICPLQQNVKDRDERISELGNTA